MSRLLSELSEERITSGDRHAATAIEEAGFSEELKKRLQDRIAEVTFRSNNASASAQAGLPASAGKEGKDIAAASATPWEGSETVADATLRMLTDSYKPMQGRAKTETIPRTPKLVDTGRPNHRAGAGTRLANARDRTSVYELMKDSGMSREERARFHEELKQRFAPTARAVPATINGLVSLANERIDKAIAQGQFKNLPRGKPIERDYNASSPFIDTTEYFMNKIIQKQEIVPPWIEKQQEVVSTATRFRSRLRADWKRHASRVISSRGGALKEQMRLADEHAYAEYFYNSPKRTQEQRNCVNESEQASQLILAGRMKVQPLVGDKARENEETVEDEIEALEQVLTDDGFVKTSRQKASLPMKQLNGASQAAVPDPTSLNRHPTVSLFRDPDWERTERAYHRAAIGQLNALTRTYNLMAPALAHKPYFSLDRELKACFADVAPHVAAAIKERATAPKLKGIDIVGHKPGGVLEKFSTEKTTRVWDEQKPQYGFREFWRDLFGGPKN